MPLKYLFWTLMIGYIDSGEKHCFFETVNTDNQVVYKFFYENNMIDIFYSCFAYGTLRIHTSFDVNMKADKFNDDIASLIQISLDKSSNTSCMICIRNENKQMFEFIKENFKIPPNKGKYYYASIEFIMRRKNFIKEFNDSILVIRPYEKEYIDNYLNLLDNSMTFTSTQPNFMGRKEHYLQYFAERNENRSFESFWKDNKLIGLYWRKNAEIDFFAIEVNNQRKGYGTIMLTRAIEMVFENTSEDFVYLYAVDWNQKAQLFYRNYGMEENGHSYILNYNKE